MVYIPKSKLKSQETPGGEFITKNNKKDYIGPYIETSEGKYFAGNNILYLGAELIKPFTVSTKFGGGQDFNRYLRLKQEPYNTLSITKDIPTTKIPPTEEDYEAGFYMRYFMKRINHHSDYKEIKRVSPKKGRAIYFDGDIYHAGNNPIKYDKRI